MLLGVPDEITNVTRVSRMFWRRRLIYRMTSFGYRKVFGHYRECTGSEEWVPEVHREGGNPPGGSPKDLWVAHQTLVGLWDSPIRPMRHKRKTKERKKKVGRKGRTPPSNPSWTRIGGGFLLPPFGRPPWGSLSLKASFPSLLLYIWSN